MKVSQLKARTTTVPVVVPGSDGEADETVNIIIRPGSMTLALWDKLKGLGKQSDTETIREFLMQENDPLLIGWDLEAEDGSQLPCNYEILSTLPFDFLGMLVNAISEDQIPNAARGGISDASSQQTEPSETSPTGTESSAQQTGSLVSLGS